MQVNIIEHSGVLLGEIVSDTVVMHTVQDALDCMAEVRYLGAEAMLLRQEHLPADFFVLRTRLAGDILQKYSNYRMRLAIIGAFEAVESESLRAFIRESNQGRQVAFLPDRGTALAWLTSADPERC